MRKVNWNGVKFVPVIRDIKIMQIMLFCINLNQDKLKLSDSLAA